MLRTMPQVASPTDELASLRSENAALRAALSANEIPLPASWRLTATEATITRALLTTEQVTKQALSLIIWRRDGTSKDLKNLDVFISRIRGKTAGAGMKIETIFGEGYRLADRDAWMKALTLGKHERN
jgi:DNA-binding response OmpR family regulator